MGQDRPRDTTRTVKDIPLPVEDLSLTSRRSESESPGPFCPRGGLGQRSAFRGDLERSRRATEPTSDDLSQGSCTPVPLPRRYRLPETDSPVSNVRDTPSPARSRHSSRPTTGAGGKGTPARRVRRPPPSRMCKRMDPGKRRPDECTYPGRTQTFYLTLKARRHLES